MCSFLSSRRQQTEEWGAVQKTLQPVVEEIISLSTRASLLSPTPAEQLPQKTAAYRLPRAAEILQQKKQRAASLQPQDEPQTLRPAKQRSPRHSVGSSAITAEAPVAMELSAEDFSSMLLERTPQAKDKLSTHDIRKRLGCVLLFLYMDCVTVYYWHNICTSISPSLQSR